MKWLKIAGAGLLLALLALWGGSEWYQRASRQIEFFADDIAAFEAEDRRAPPPEGAVLFVGSSSIRFWGSLAEDMAPLVVVRRGFGGSHLAHVLYYAPRIILPYRPRAVVVYAGDNDLAKGDKTAETVLGEYRALVDLIHRELPDTRIYYLSIKPSILRWSRWPEMSRANRAIAELSDADALLRFLDVGSVLLGADGQPDAGYFMPDGLHLNEAGYAAWTQVIKPILLADLEHQGDRAD